MVGIYKVTNPVGQIYIGQSKDVNRRIKLHKGIISSDKRYLLKESYLKYGFENHKFELINECYEEDLLELERYWQDKYDAIGPNGLNMELTKTCDKPRVLRNKPTKPLFKKPDAKCEKCSLDTSKFDGLCEVCDSSLIHEIKLSRIMYAKN